MAKIFDENNKEDILREIMRQVLFSLHFMHEQNWLHSDVKAENIMLTGNGYEARLIDFGCSCEVGSRDCCMTRVIMPPEFLLKAGYLPTSDMWSVGLMVTQLITGERQFMSEEKSALMDAWHDMLGPLPQHVLDSGKKTGQFFHPNGTLIVTPEIEERRSMDIPQDRFEDVLDEE